MKVIYQCLRYRRTLDNTFTRYRSVLTYRTIQGDTNNIKSQPAKEPLLLHDIPEGP